jgi:hypothetical protein
LRVKAKDHIEIVLATAVIYTSVIIITLFSLSIFRAVSSVNIIIFLSIILAGFLILNYKSWEMFVTGTKKFIYKVVSTPKNILELDSAGKYALVLTLIIAFLFLVVGILAPSYESDALLYHLPMAVKWLKAKSVFGLPVSTSLGDLKWSVYYPANSQLVILWNILPYNDDFLTNTYEWFYAVIASLACYGISRQLKIPQKYAIWSFVFFLIAPIVLYQSITTYHDVMYTSFFLVGVYFLFSYSSTKELWKILFSIMNISIMLGIKYVSVFYFLTYLILLFVQGWNKRLIYKKIVPFIYIFFFFSLLFLGGYWYIRNLVEKGSFIYPVFDQIPIDYKFRTSRFVPSPSISDRILYPFSDSKWYSFEAGYGPHFAVLGILSILFGVVYSFKNKSYRVFSFISILLLLLYFSFPIFDPRYYLPVLALAGINFSFMLANISSHSLETIIKFLFIIFILMIIFKLVPFFYDYRTFQLFNKTLTRYEYYASVDDRGKIFKNFDDEVRNSNVVVMIYGVYPFYGTDYSNDVVYVEKFDEKSLKEKNINYIVLSKDVTPDVLEIVRNSENVVEIPSMVRGLESENIFIFEIKS